MLLLLNGIAGALGQLLLVLALVCFLFAFILGRKNPPHPDHDARNDDAAGDPDEPPRSGA